MKIFYYKEDDQPVNMRLVVLTLLRKFEGRDDVEILEDGENRQVIVIAKSKKAIEEIENDN